MSPTAPNINLIILFVANPIKSSQFYSRLFDLTPVEESPTFAMFALPNGLSLGLWSPTTAEPPVSTPAGASEICINDPEIDNLYEHWVQLGAKIAQKPTDMDFGRTFVALDPDGHRVRVYRFHEVAP